MTSISERLAEGSTPIPFSGCRIWLKATASVRHYGAVHYNGKMQYAHRIAWELENGPIPEGMFVCHTCDVPSCINPNHLFLGTPSDNTADMVRKGRAKGSPPSGDGNPVRKNPWIVRGENSGQAKLARADVAEIFRRYAAGETQKELGVAFKVAQCHISRIIRKKSWGHL